MQILEVAGAMVLAIIAVACFRFALRLYRFDATEYEKSRSRFKSPMGALRGDALMRRDSIPDGRVRAGMVYNMRANRIELNGKLSDAVVDRVLR